MGRPLDSEEAKSTSPQTSPAYRMRASVHKTYVAHFHYRDLSVQNAESFPAYWFDDQQARYFPILPPVGVTITQSYYSVPLAFDPAGMPRALLEGMTGHVQYDCPVYDILLMEDPQTREMVVFNESGEEIYSLPAVADYYPHAYDLWRFPDLYSGTYTAEQVAEILAIYDPARIRCLVRLVQRGGPAQGHGLPLLAPEAGGARMDSAARAAERRRGELEVFGAGPPRPRTVLRVVRGRGVAVQGAGPVHRLG